MIRHVRRGDRITAEAYNALVDEINRLHVTVGPGLESRKTASGVLLSLQPRKITNNTAGEATDCTGGTLDELGATQGTQDTDAWDRATDECPVSVEVITDVEYNTTSLELSYRTRLLTFDKCGKLSSVGAEGNLVEITTAVTCT